MVDNIDNKNHHKPKKLIAGSVISNKMGKTVVVRVERIYRHPEFHKIVRSYKNYKVHDEHGKAHVGDIVEFYESRPYSKTKHACLYQVVKKENQ